MILLPQAPRYFNHRRVRPHLALPSGPHVPQEVWHETAPHLSLMSVREADTDLPLSWHPGLGGDFNIFMSLVIKANFSSRCSSSMGRLSPLASGRFSQINDVLNKTLLLVAQSSDTTIACVRCSVNTQGPASVSVQACVLSRGSIWN